MDIWISLTGSDPGGDGTSSNPYRTLKYAYTHNTGANRFILSNSGGTPTSLFVEEPLSFDNETGITVYAEALGTVFIKAPKWTITGSTIVMSGVVLIPAVDTEPIHLSASGSDISFMDCLVQDAKQTAIYASGSKVSFNSCTIQGADAVADLVSLENNCRVSYAGGLYFTGTYNTGLTIDAPQNVEGQVLSFSGIFNEAAVLDFTDSSSPTVLMVETAITNQDLTRQPNGLKIIGLRNDQSVSSLYKVIAYRCNTGLTFIESDVEIDKVTIDACQTGVIASESCGILLSNGVISNCGLALQANTNSVIQYRYFDLYGNSLDYETEYADLTVPDEFRIYLSAPVAYDLSNNNIKPGSEVVTASEVVGVTYVRNVDYTIDYGSDISLGSISRLAAGNIPDGQLIKIKYKYKNLANITGTVAPGARIRHVDPRYKDAIQFDYTLADDSPLIEAGVYTGRDFVGTAPDMGFYERTRSMSAAETILQLNLKSQEDVTILEPDVVNTIQLQLDNIAAYNPNIDISEGSAIRDLLIKPAGHLLDAPKVERNYLMLQQSILNYDTMTEGELDLLAGNYFLTRRQGQRATGVVRLYFSRPSDAVVPVGTTFTTGSTSFLTQRDQIFLSDEMIYNTQGDLYFADVAIVGAAIGEEYVVAANTIRTVTNYQHPYLMSITNPIATENGLNPESNAELYARLKTAWTLRALVSPRSVSTMLLDMFADIRHLSVVGARDIYMNRDVIRDLRPYVGDYHTYGRVDVYVMTYDHHEIYQDYELSSTATMRIDEYTVYRPIVYIKKIEVLDINGVPLREIPLSEYEMIIDDDNTRFSIREKMTIKMNDVAQYALKTVRVTYVTSKSILDIQSYADSDEVRNVCTDILIKHYVPKVVDCQINYETAKIQNISTTVIAAVEEHINSQESGQDVGLSTFSTPIFFAGADNFQTPLSVTVETWMQTGVVVIQAIEDAIPCSRIEHLISGNITATKV